MATKLKTFDWTHTSKLTTSEKATYPWEDWFDGDIWQLTADEDFDGHPLMMERIIRTRATGRGAKIRMRHEPLNGDQWGIIVLQRKDITGPSAAKRAVANEKRAATRASKNGSAEVTNISTKRKPVVNEAPAVKKVNGAVSKVPSKKLAAKV